MHRHSSVDTILEIGLAIVNVQNLAANVSDHRKPSLRQCLKTLDLAHEVPKCEPSRPHRAGNDTVYTLALLAALLSYPSDAPTLLISKKIKAPVLFCGRPRPARRYPFTAQILTPNRSPLHLELDTAAKIHRRFSLFHPIATGTGVV
jgi:hypothetical protein